MSNTEFNPNWASHPGETILDCLKEAGFDASALPGLLVGIPADESAGLLTGETRITEQIAAALEEAFGTPAIFWMQRDAQYVQAAARLYPAKVKALEEAEKKAAHLERVIHQVLIVMDSNNDEYDDAIVWGQATVACRKAVEGAEPNELDRLMLEQIGAAHVRVAQLTAALRQIADSYDVPASILCDAARAFLVRQEGKTQ